MKSILYGLCLIGMMLSFTSCEKDLLDVDPIDQIPAEKAILTMSDLLTAVNGVYATLSPRRPVYVSSFISDEIRLGVGTEYRNVGNGLYNWQSVSDSQDWRDGENGGIWTNRYQIIDRANRVLELMVPVPTIGTTEAALKAQYRGEMLAMRAMAHLELLRNFSATAQYSPTALGIVVSKEYIKAPGSARPVRTAQEDAVKLIDDDLLEARGLIPTSFVDIGRITRNAVIGGQVRIALHTRRWQNVIDRATEIIPLQPLNSIGTYAALWSTRTLASSQATEVIWKYNVQPSNLGAAIGSLYQDANGAQQAAPSAKLLNTFDRVNDVRFNAFFLTVPRNLIAKYGAVPPAGENFQFDIKLMRTSEIVLARAEARAELDLLTLGNADLSNLRTNRITGYVHVDLTTKQALLDAIILERYKELCYEGNRYYDLKRKGLPVVRDVSDIGGIPTSQTLLTTDLNYILPIPFAEIFANPNMVQNTGY